MRVLVTGGAGFVGSHLVVRLQAMGHFVSVLDDFSTGRRELPSGARLIEGDVRDSSIVRQALQGQDAVFHLAAVVGVPHAMARQWDSLTTNIVGTLRILEAIEGEGTPLLLCSSSAIYGKTLRVPVQEEDDVQLGNTHVASWTYSYAKLAEELFARAAHAERGTRVKIVRLFNAIGPGQSGRYGMVVPRLVARALAGQPLLVYGDGEQTRTFVDVRDAVAGMLLVWEWGRWGDVYNVGGVEEVRIADLARRIIALTASRSTIQLVPYDQAFGARFEETPRRVPRIDKVRSLGYEPRITLDETILAVAASLGAAEEEA
ncbi:MAG: NAD-dependent epimerase/dehydratase family protein [Thermaerobacter sp.]|nr:NAD-dependent epimerase/dehydratase family protein [Thermaerobacter sp.]